MNGMTLYDNLNNFPMMALYGGPINCWTYGSTASTYLPGRVASWGMYGSLHPAGCNVVMADGSVHFINESTNLTVLTLLCNLADGAAVGEF
jgi:prepilin-type processing-associated H-X9-DG protein